MKGRMLVAVQFLSLIALVLLPPSPETSSLRTNVARFLVISASFVLVVAFLALRESVTVLPEPRENVPLITHGIYSIIRHPMYTAVLTFGAAMVLTRWTLATALVWVILYIDLTIKYRYEDSLLLKKWPQAKEYQQKVGALLPRFW